MIAKKVLEVIVVVALTLLILLGDQINGINLDTMKLISTVCLVLVIVAYCVSTLFKNLICRCIRCPAF